MLSAAAIQAKLAKARGKLPSDVSHLHAVRRTVLQMLKDRGYVVEQAEIDWQPDDFARRFGTEPDNNVSRDDLMILAQKKQSEQEVNEMKKPEQILVCFFEQPKVGVKPVKDLAYRMRQEGVQKAILVVQDKVTAFARQCIAELAPKFELEVFTEADLRVNIMHHELVPEHQVLTPAEKAQLLERYKVKDTQLPRIQRDDPVARYYGIQRGQVVRILRSSETAGRYVTYRLCV